MVDYEVERYIVKKEHTLLEAMQIINQNRQGIGFVCENNRLLGALSDGDIRRKLIKSNDLFSNVDSAANYNVLYVYYGEKERAEKLLYETDVTAIPLVDGNNRIIAVAVKEVLRPITEHRVNIPVAIMAGGKGTRLRPYTDVLPKPLIPVGNKTIVERIIDQFKNVGCSKFIMIVNYKKELLKAYFDEIQHDYGIAFYEEEQFLGTAGGLKFLENEISETFFVSNCDILVEADYDKILEYHRKMDNIITMVCAGKKFQVPYGTVQVDEAGQIVGLQEKPELSYRVNTGLYLIEPRFLDKIPDGEFIHITDIIEKCLREKERVGAFLIEDDDWMDMGQMDELESMRKKMGFQ